MFATKIPVYTNWMYTHIHIHIHKHLKCVEACHSGIILSNIEEKKAINAQWREEDEQKQLQRQIGKSSSKSQNLLNIIYNHTLKVSSIALRLWLRLLLLLLLWLWLWLMPLLLQECQPIYNVNLFLPCFNLFVFFHFCLETIFILHLLINSVQPTQKFSQKENPQQQPSITL